MIQSEVIAIITAASGLIGLGISLLSIYQSNKNNESNQKHEDDITILKNSLEIQKSEKDALLDYKYDAKKRLYAEYEPLIFQLHELSESSLRRIRNIAWMARDGKLDPWLSNTENHYIMNTVYRLLAPFIIFKLMQRRLTLFDLNLSPYFYIQYVLVKILYHTFSKDFDHAKLDPKLDYDPNLEGERDPSLNTVKILKFIIPLVIIFIVWMVARSMVNSNFDEADRMLAKGCYYTSTDWLGAGKDWICP